MWKKLKKAEELLVEAANAGNAIAQNNLAVFYMEGMSGHSDEFTAIEWYKKSADAGYPPAQLAIGLAYIQGTGVPRADSIKGAQWILKAAEAGNIEAMNNIGVCYFNGIGIEKITLLQCIGMRSRLWEDTP